MRKFAKFGLRLFSIFLFIKFINYIFNSVGFVSIFASENFELTLPKLFMVIGPPLIYLLFSICFWVFSEKFSKWIVREDETINFDSEFNFIKFERIVLSLIGLTIMIIGFTGSVSNITGIFFSQSIGKHMTILPGLAKNLIFIYIGIILIKKGEKILDNLRKKLNSNK